MSRYPTLVSVVTYDACCQAQVIGGVKQRKEKESSFLRFHTHRISIQHVLAGSEAFPARSLYGGKASIISTTVDVNA